MQESWALEDSGQTKRYIFFFLQHIVKLCRSLPQDVVMANNLYYDCIKVLNKFMEDKATKDYTGSFVPTVVPLPEQHPISFLRNRDNGKRGLAKEPRALY